MATVTDRRIRPAPAKTETDAALKPRRRWRFLLVLTLGCLFTAIALLPTFASRSPLANWLVSRATTDLEGEVSVGSIHLGWFSAPVLTDIEIRDSQQRSLLEVERVRAERSLLSLLFK